VKKFILASVVAWGPMVAAADPIAGIWQTPKDDNGEYGHVEIGDCGAKICGTVVKGFDSTGKLLPNAPLTGRKIIWDMENDGGGKYSGGKIYSPERAKTYNGQLHLSGSSLNVKGCMLGFCQSGGTWSRVR